MEIFGDTVTPSFGKSHVKEESVFVASTEENEVYFFNRLGDFGCRGGRDFERSTAFIIGLRTGVLMAIFTLGKQSQKD